jgi:hypothetical protein
MPITELDDEYDEDWYDDDSDDDDWAPCPECGEAVYAITGKCPVCGYWLSAADQRAMLARLSKPLWLKLTAVVLLIALLAGMFGVVVGVF